MYAPRISCNSVCDIVDSSIFHLHGIADSRNPQSALWSTCWNCDFVPLQRSTGCTRACRSRCYYWGSAYPFGGTPRQCPVSRSPTPASASYRSWISGSPRRSRWRRFRATAPSCSRERSGERSRMLVSKLRITRCGKHDNTIPRWWWKRDERENNSTKCWRQERFEGFA